MKKTVSFLTMFLFVCTVLFSVVLAAEEQTEPQSALSAEDIEKEDKEEEEISETEPKTEKEAETTSLQTTEKAMASPVEEPFAFLDGANVNYPVTNESSLILALSQADQSDSITFQNDITITSPLTPPAQDFTINGNGYSLLLDAGYSGRHILDTSGAEHEITIENLTLKGHNSGNPGSLSSRAAGGGIEITGSSTVYILDVGTVIQGNHSNDYGGGLKTSGGTFLIQSDSIVTQNTSSVGGGGIAAIGDTNIFFSSSQLTNNMAPIGGGIYTESRRIAEDEPNAISMHFSTATGNMATTGSGGAIHAATPEAVIQAIGDIFTDNTAATDGGAIYGGGMLDSSSCTYRNNSAQRGGAVAMFTTYEFYGDTLQNNSAQTMGGAIYTDNPFIYSAGSRTGLFQMRNMNFSGNSVTSGGIYWDLNAPKGITGLDTIQPDIARLFPNRITTNSLSAADRAGVTYNNPFNNQDVSMTSFPVVLDPNGGKWGDSSTGEKTLDVKNSTLADALQEEPTRDGYYLKGWEIDSDLSTGYTGGAWDEDAIFDGPVRLKALWAEELTLTYFSNNGDGLDAQESPYKEGDQITLKDLSDYGWNTPLDKVFVGWTDEPNSQNPTIYRPGTTYTITQDTDLYAYFVDDGDSALTYRIDSTNYEDGEYLTGSDVPLKTPQELDPAWSAPEHMEFAGWAIEEGGEPLYQPGDDFILLQDTTLYAVVKYRQVYVTYYLNDGSGVFFKDGPFQCGSDFTFRSLSDIDATWLAPADMEFVGWALTPGETRALDEIFLVGRTMVLSDEMELYARYEAVVVPIDPAGPDGDPAPVAGAGSAGSPLSSEEISAVNTSTAAAVQNALRSSYLSSQNAATGDTSPLWYLLALLALLPLGFALKQKYKRN